MGVYAKYSVCYIDLWNIIYAIHNRYNIIYYSNTFNKKKIVNKNKKFKALIYVIVILVCGYVSIKVGYSFLLYASAKPDKLYTEMKEINESERLIGLSKEQVIELLGKPRGDEEKDVYYYDAGKVTNYLFFGEIDFYELRIIFDENDIVEYTSIKEVV